MSPSLLAPVGFSVAQAQTRAHRGSFVQKYDVRAQAYSKTLADPGALDRLDSSLRSVSLENIRDAEIGHRTSMAPPPERSAPILIKQLRQNPYEANPKDHFGSGFLAEHYATKMERQSSGAMSAANSFEPSSFHFNMLSDASSHCVGTECSPGSPLSRRMSFDRQGRAAIQHLLLPGESKSRQPSVERNARTCQWREHVPFGEIGLFEGFSRNGSPVPDACPNHRKLTDHGYADASSSQPFGAVDGGQEFFAQRDDSDSEGDSRQGISPVASPNLFAFSSPMGRHQPLLQKV